MNKCMNKFNIFLCVFILDVSRSREDSYISLTFFEKFEKNVLIFWGIVS